MYCPYLWKSQCILTDGKVSPCCHSSSKKNWKNIDFEQGIYSKEHRIARETMQNNGWPDVCAVCENNEKQNIKSPRQRALERFNSHTEQIKLEYLDIKFSNVCNLSCRMCNPASSSQLEYLYSKDKKDDIPSFLQFYHRKSLRETSDNEFRKERYVKQCIIDGLEHLKVTGGEPFASRPFLNVIDWCDEENYCENVGLSVTTNGTKYNQLLLWKLSKFKYLNVVVSVDGTGKIYDYIRQGSTWEKLQRNLGSFDDFFKDKKDKLRYHNNTIHIATILQFYNIFDIPNLIDWCVDKNYRLKVDVNLKPEDSELSIKYLPLFLKREAIKDLQAKQKEHSDKSWVVDQVTNIVKYIVSTEGKEDNNKHKELKKTISIQDKKHKTKYFDYLDKRQVDFIDHV